jgi:hypothetical protein
MNSRMTVSLEQKSRRVSGVSLLAGHFLTMGIKYRDGHAWKARAPNFDNSVATRHKSQILLTHSFIYIQPGLPNHTNSYLNQILPKTNPEPLAFEGKCYQEELPAKSDTSETRLKNPLSPQISALHQLPFHRHCCTRLEPHLA